MTDSDQQIKNRLNDKFPISYFHREKIEKLAPLCFEHSYYSQYDRFQVIETGGIFRIDSLNYRTKEYLFHHISGSRDLKPGYTTFYLGNDADDVKVTERDPFTKLRCLLDAKDYYHVGDILYDLSNQVEEIPECLFNYILEICDGIC